MSNKETLWLYCEPFSPLSFAIQEEKEALIGRHKKCDLVLPHSSVSRQHARVSSIKGAVIIEDLKSSNGTYVNSKKIKNIFPLVVGDAIRIGPYEIEVREIPYNQEAPFFGETNVLNFQNDKAASMAGSLEKISLVELLQSIEFNTKTGTLYVETGDRNGLFVYASGRPINAQFGALKGIPAIIEMLDLTSGNFVVVEKIEPLDVELNTSITNILLEYSRIQDESADKTLFDYGMDD